MPSARGADASSRWFIPSRHQRNAITPSNANILLIRHAEKPDQGTGLSPAGQARAQAYVAYFQNYAIGGDAVRLKYIFATADSHESHRPRLTVTPLAQALGVEINDRHADKDYAKVATTC